MRRFVGMRFRQQTHELAVEVPGGALDATSLDRLVDDFTERYERVYGKGTALRVAGVEFTVLRVDGHVPVTKPAPVMHPQSNELLAPSGRREVYFDELAASVPAPVLRPQDVTLGGEIGGPALIDLVGTTVVVGPRQTALIDGHGHITIELGGSR
jgi:N-methylhydantoinase A